MQTSGEIRQTAKEKLFSNTNSIVLYGAGGVGRDVLNLMISLGINVRCFIDQKDLQITEIDGIPIYKPDDRRFTEPDRANTIVIFSIFNKYVSIPKIQTQLNKLGWINFINFLELHKSFPDQLGKRFWLTNMEFYKEKEIFYKKAEDIWADSKSKSLYKKILEFRFSQDYSVLSDPELDNQYFPEDIPKWNYPLQLIDCGAYDGDTLRDIFSKEIPFEKIAAFEPDIANFIKLSKESQKTQKEILLYPCGVYSHCCQLRFDSGNNSGSAIDLNGNTVVQCVSIDEALPNFSPNLIKMDIEGAEYAALIGTRKTIEKYQPGLAICLYHNPEHIWQIPLLLRDYAVDYSYYLRSHAYSGFELVLYAIPN